jgi:hypothetical protein
MRSAFALGFGHSMILLMVSKEGLGGASPELFGSMCGEESEEVIL